MSQPRSPRKNRAAFTLVEMLVSVAVLVLLMTFVAQMMNSTMLSTTLSGKHVDTDGEARLVFDRMAIDFGRMIRRNDVDYIFSKQPYNSTPSTPSGTSGSSDEMFFYSEGPAYFPTVTSGTIINSSVALTGYSIYTTGTNPATPNYSLLRLSKGLSWDATNPSGPGGMIFLTAASGTSLPIAASSLPGATGSPNFNGAIGFSPSYIPGDLTDYDVLSSKVFRMEYCFQVKDLTYQTNSKATPGTVYSNYPVAYFQSGVANTRTINTQSNMPTNPVVGDRFYDTGNNRAYVCSGYTGAAAGTPTPIWTPNGMSDVTAIIVAIAILDKNSRSLVNNNLGQLASALADPTEDNNPSTGLQAQPPHLMAETWQNAIGSATFASSAGIPQVAAAQIRVYQRFFYLNNN